MDSIPACPVDAEPCGLIGKHALLVVRARALRERTVLQPARRRIPFQWHGSHYQNHDDQPYLLLQSSSGGFVEGDSATFALEAERDTRCLITTTEAPKFYRAEGTEPSVERNFFTLAPGAALEYLPDEVIPYAQSRVERVTRFDVHSSAQLIAAEVLTAGRVHHRANEMFGFRSMKSSLELTVDGRLRLADRMRMEPPNRGDFAAAWGGFPIYGTVVAYSEALSGDAVAAELEQDFPASPNLRLGASIRENVLVVRVLGHETWRVHEAIYCVWAHLRPLLLGKPARPIVKA